MRRCTSTPSAPPSRATCRLVLARLGRHQRNRIGRYVRCVDHDDVDSTLQLRRQRVEQVTFVNVAVWLEVEPSTRHGRRIDVCRVQLDPLTRLQHGRTDRTGAATQVDDDRTGPRQAAGLDDQNLGTSPRHEHTGLDDDPQVANSTQPRMCSRGSPAMRRMTIASSPSGDSASSTSSCASSSAYTHPAARRRSTISSVIRATTNCASSCCSST